MHGSYKGAGVQGGREGNTIRFFAHMNFLRRLECLRVAMAAEQFHRTSEIHDYHLRGSNYDLQLPLPKPIFSSAHFLIGVQWLGTNCQMKHVRWGILLALNSPYLRI